MGFWKLIAWIVPSLVRRWPPGAFGYAGPMLAGDLDRERASATLREHYARGYLTLDDLSQRTSRVLTARSRLELRAALFGLPRGGSWALPVASDPRGLIAQGRSVAQTAVRGVVLVLCTGAYVLFSFSLLVVLALTLLVHGASSSVLLVFLILWLVPTYLLSRLWRRKPH